MGIRARKRHPPFHTVARQPRPLTASPVFAPQTAKILAPLPNLTVAQVTATLTDDGTDPAP
ncbi:hypothetical protein ACWGA0_24940 [Streptomyces erythrochromogenes]